MVQTIDADISIIRGHYYYHGPSILLIIITLGNLVQIGRYVYIIYSSLRWVLIHSSGKLTTILHYTIYKLNMVYFTTRMNLYSRTIYCVYVQVLCMRSPYYNIRHDHNPIVTHWRLFHRRTYYCNNILCIYKIIITYTVDVCPSKGIGQILKRYGRIRFSNFYYRFIGYLPLIFVILKLQYEYFIKMLYLPT